MKVFAIDAWARDGAETAKDVTAAHADEPFEQADNSLSIEEVSSRDVDGDEGGWEFSAPVTDRHSWI